jgi:hypothetical protein
MCLVPQSLGARPDFRRWTSRASALRLQAPPRCCSARLYGLAIGGVSGFRASRLSRNHVCDPFYARQSRALHMMRNRAFDVVLKALGTVGILKYSLCYHCRHGMLVEIAKLRMLVSVEAPLCMTRHGRRVTIVVALWASIMSCCAHSKAVRSVTRDEDSWRTSSHLSDDWTRE